MVYFAANDEDIDPGDTQYVDILLACTKHLIQAIKLADENPLKGLINWLEERADSLKSLLLTPLKLEGLNLEQKVSEFTKITATLKAQPDNRTKIREQISQNAPTLLQALNEFIEGAKKALPNNCKDLILMVDNLDRIIEKQAAENQPSNYDEIFIKHHEQMRGLIPFFKTLVIDPLGQSLTVSGSSMSSILKFGIKCHLIYTVPIDIVYSERCTELQNNFDETDVLPMVMLRDQDDQIDALGLEKFREIIVKRIAEVELSQQSNVGQELAKALDTKVFSSSEVVERICLMSGGHVRLLMRMIQKAIDWTDDLPITAEAVNTAIEEAKDDYRNTIFEHQWPLLREVAETKQILNKETDKEYQRLLRSRCILEYRFYDQKGKLQRWYDVHPLVKDLERFGEVGDG